MNNKFRWPAGAALLVVAGEAAQAEVVFDGSLGPVATLSGAFEIPNSHGTQVGANLFHSFARFNINPGESATFTSNFGGLTTQVIGRVTGGAPSVIDGALSSSIAGASLWLVNPDGLIFGPGAVLDVDGGFYASTADFLAFEDGGLFAATDPGASMLTVATPAAFGFLDGNVAPITAGAATLGVHEGERLSLVGGDLVLTGTTLLAPNGAIDLGSVAGAGTMRPTLEVGGVAALGAVTLRGANVDTTAASGGEVHIRGGRLVLEMSSFLTANTVGGDTTARGGDILIDVGDAAILGGSQLSSTTFGAGNGGLIRLNAVGDVSIEGNAGGTPAGIFANVRAGASGDGGRIEVAARDLRIGPGGLMGAVTFGSGDGGDIELAATDTVAIRGGAIFLNSLASATGAVGSIEITADRLVMTELGQLQANTFNAPGGQVAIAVDSLEMADGSQISTATFGPGSGGVLRANARVVSLRGTSAQGFPTGLFTTSNFPSGGPGGALAVNADTLTIAAGAQLASGTGGLGPAGPLDVVASERVVIDGEGLTFPLFTGIFANTFGNAAAGSIHIVAPQLELRQGGFIQSGSFAPNPLAVGPGGNIRIDANDLTIDAAFVEARTETSGRGGNLAVNVSGTIELRNSTGFVFTPGLGQPIGGLLTSAGGLFNSPVATGSAGDMTVNAGSLVIRDGGVLSADTFLRGDAGAITVVADTIDVFGETSALTGVFDSSVTTGRAGSINLAANEITIAGLASVTAAAFAAGDAGAIAIDADRVSIVSGGSVVSSTFGAGAGGDVVIVAPRVEVASDGTISASATGTGNAGTITAVAPDELEINGGSITTSSEQSAGGNITLEVGRMLFVDGGTISAAARGVTAQDSGGNVSIDPEFVVVRGGTIVASANAGNGGNVDIRAGTFVLDTATTIDASSNLGLDGVIAIDSPHEVTGELLPMAPPIAGVSALVSQRCVPALYAERSSLTVEPIRAAAPSRFVPTPFDPVDARVEGFAEPLRASASDAGAATFENCYRGARGD